MKIITVLTLIALSSAAAGAEETRFDLDAYNATFDKIQKTGMLVLGGWAVANFIGGAVPLAVAGRNLDDDLYYFLFMNIGWNVVNASLAGVGYFGCCRKSPVDYTLSETVKRQYNAEKTFLFNAGLDIGYIAFGLFLTSRANAVENPAMLRGFGYSLMLQGAWLFAFDIVVPWIHSRHRRSLDTALSRL